MVHRLVLSVDNTVMLETVDKPLLPGQRYKPVRTVLYAVRSLVRSAVRTVRYPLRHC
jgi:hypothetical protein